MRVKPIIVSDFEIKEMDYLGEYVPGQRRAVVYLWGHYYEGTEHEIRYITGVILHEVLEGLIYELIGYFAPEWVIVEIQDAVGFWFDM